MVTGRIFDIQRFSIHDGPGIRTTVFFQGCPLRCLWCGNPESIRPRGAVLPSRPLHQLWRLCPGVSERALSRAPPAPSPWIAAAVRIAGSVWRNALPRRWNSWPRSHGAGGARSRAAGSGLLRRIPRRTHALRRRPGVSAAVCGGPAAGRQNSRPAQLRRDSGYALWGALRGLLPLVDLWLYDFKETDRRLHEEFTGKPNTLVLENLERLHEAGAKILLRCPLIPSQCASGASGWHRRPHPAVAETAGVELLPYYDLWRAKLPRFGLETKLPSRSDRPTKRPSGPGSSTCVSAGTDGGLTEPRTDPRLAIVARF